MACLSGNSSILSKQLTSVSILIADYPILTQNATTGLSAGSVGRTASRILLARIIKSPDCSLNYSDLNIAMANICISQFPLD